MTCEVPLTSEQCLFATEHHGLVYSFLYANDLPIDEFYDVVIFGYLRAVSRYFNEPELQQYSFTTIAWRRMLACISDHRRKQRRPKHNADVISLHVGPSEDSLPLEETIGSAAAKQRGIIHIGVISARIVIKAVNFRHTKPPPYKRTSTWV